jgi:hypothetical protein
VRHMTSDTQMTCLNDRLAYTLLGEEIFEMFTASSKAEDIVKVDILNDI